MADYVIMTDSCSDLSTELLEKYNLEYAPMGVSIGDIEYAATLDWGWMDPKSFYKVMRDGTRVFTIQVSATTFEEEFTKFAAQGKDVFYVGCSGKLSGSVTTARGVAEQVAKKYGTKIIVCDPYTSGTALGYLAIVCSKMRAEGKSIEEVAAYCEANKLRYNQQATVGSLSWLAKAGRVKASTAFFGNLFGVKPILCSDKNGYNFAYQKVRGRQTSLEAVVDGVAKEILEPEDHPVFITHADCEEDAAKVEKMLKEKIPGLKEVVTLPLGPILGASCGPDTLIVSFYGKEVELASPEGNK